MNFTCTGQDSSHLDLETVAYFPTETLSLLPEDCPQTPALVPPPCPGIICYQTSPLTAGGVPGFLVHSSVVNIVKLHLRLKLNAGLV